MKFSQKQPVKIVMIGVGGTGGYIAPHLYRLLHTLNRRVRFVICDGDIVEQKNLVRQNFIEPDIGENKAKIIAERYASTFGLETEYIPRYIESTEELSRLLTPDTDAEFVILIGAVDNNRSRKMCHEAFYKAESIVYIDSGNSEFAGQVVCGVRKNGRTLYKPVAGIYPEILEDTDKFPSELSCAEAALSSPQAITANLVAATSVVCLIYNIVVLGNDNNVKQAAFSTKSLHVRPTVLQHRRRVA